MVILPGIIRTFGGCGDLDLNRVKKGISCMSRFFRLHVDQEELTDAAFAFVTDPYPSRNERPLIQELNEFYPEMVDVLECMVLDGTEARQDVAAYVHAVFSPALEEPLAPRTAL